MKGEPQNKTISKEIIDAVVAKIKDCENIALHGGEPLLEIETINYLVEKIIRSDWNTKFIQLTTNGSILDDRIIDILDKFCKSAEYRHALLRISSDEFHDQIQSEKAYEFYKRFSKNSKIKIELKGEINNFKYSGRAKTYVDNNPDRFKVQNIELHNIKNYQGVCVPMIEKHRIKVYENIIPCSFQITSEGEIILNEEISFDEADIISIGNILNESLENMIERNNSECLLTCCDSKNRWIINMNLNRYEDMHSNCIDFYIQNLICELLFKKIYKARLLAHKIYPKVPAQDVITNLLMPKDYIFDINEEIHNIYKCIQSIVNSLIDNAQKKNYDWKEIFKNIDKEIFEIYQNNTDRIGEDARELFSVLVLLKHPEILDLVDKSVTRNLHNNTKFFNLVTAKDLTKTKNFRKLKRLNRLYEEGKLSPRNDAILPCNIGDSVTGEPNLYEAVENHFNNKYDG